MATEIERLAVLIEGNTKSYENAMKRLQQQTDRAVRGASRSISTLDGQLKTMAVSAQRFAGMLGISLGIAGLQQLGRAVKDVVDEASQLVNAADRIGVTTAELQELAYTAKLADVDLQSLTGNMEKFTRNLGDAAQGSGELRDILDANGVSLTNLDGSARSVGDMLEVVADLIENAASAQDKMNIAIAAFGRGGADMVNVLEGGAVALRATGDEARRTGIIIDEEILRKAEEMGDRWDAFSVRMAASFHRGTLSMMADIQTLSEKLASVQLNVNKWLWDTFGGIGENQLQKEAAGGSGSTPLEIAVPIAASKAKPTIIPTKGGSAASDKIADTIKALEDQLRMLEMTDREQAIYNELTKAGVEANTKAGEQIAALAGQLHDQKEALAAAAEASAFFAEQAYDAFSALIPKVESGNAVLDKFLNTLIETVLQASLLGQGPLAGLFGTTSATGGVGGLLGSLFAGFFADGGVIPSGKVGIVGEKGPEIIRGPAAITPMSAANSNGGTSNLNIVVDVRGATGSQEIRTLVNQGVAGALAEYSKAQGRRSLKAG